MSSVLETSNVKGALSHQKQYRVLPWRINQRGKARILLVRHRHTECWFIPTAMPVGNQPPFLIVSKQAYQDAGIIGDIHPEPLTEYLSMEVVEDGMVKPHHVTVFSMEVYGTIANWIGKAHKERLWFSVEDAADKLDNSAMADFLRAHGSFPNTTEEGGLE